VGNGGEEAGGVQVFADGGVVPIGEVGDEVQQSRTEFGWLRVEG
jgi:hypothetical protein